MEATLLSALCTICHIDAPKYTCPRCFTLTCSLTCSKRHKLWSSCNGVRDATVYKPISEVATPAGIDHDYNFLHAIEHSISRSEKVLIEDLGLVTREELEMARKGDEGQGRPRKTHDGPGDVCIRNILQEHRIGVVKAPRGMRRSRENTTSWSRKRKTIDWQVEWLREGADRVLYKVAGNRPIGNQYDLLCDEERRMKMSDEEKKSSKKRKAHDLRNQNRAAKRPCDDVPALPQQDIASKLPTPEASSEQSHRREYYLYLHRPLTPASLPRVLVPLDADLPLTELLAGRHVLEFPSIYVLPNEPVALPKVFMLEKDYVARRDHLRMDQSSSASDGCGGRNSSNSGDRGDRGSSSSSRSRSRSNSSSSSSCSNSFSSSSSSDGDGDDDEA